MAVRAAVAAGRDVPMRLRLVGSGTEDSRLRALVVELKAGNVVIEDRVSVAQAGISRQRG